MFTVKVTGIEALRRNLARLPADIEAKVVQPALNRTAEKARAEINRAIPQEYAVKASEVRNAVEIRRARTGDLRAVLSVFGSARKRGRSMNLIHFLASVAGTKTRGSRAKKAELKALGRQLGFNIRRDAGLKSIAGAFVGNKGRTIFRRTGDARFPIEPVQVIGYSQMFGSQKISKRVLDKIRGDLPIEIDRALSRVLKGAS